MAGIELQRKQIDARLGQRARPVETSVAAQTQLAGFEAAAGIAGRLGLQIFENESRAAVADAESKVKLSGMKYRQSYVRELENVKSVAEGLALKKKFVTGIDQNWNQSVSEAEKHVLRGSKNSFKAKKRTDGELNKLAMENFFESATDEAIRDNLQDVFNTAMEIGDLEWATEVLTDGKAYFGSSFLPKLAQINKQQKEQQEGAFENELESKLAEGQDQFNEFIATPGIENEFGLKAEDAQRVINVFKDKVNTQKSQLKAANEERKNAEDASHSEAIYKNRNLKYKDVFYPDSPLTDAEKRSTWKEYKSELANIANGDTVDGTVEDEMSRLYGEYTQNPSKANKDAANKYRQDNRNKLSSAENRRYRVGLLEDDPDAEDKKVIANEGIVRINDLAAQEVSINKQTVGKDEVLGLDTIRRIEDEAARDRNAYRQWMQDAREKNITLTDEDHRKKINSLTRPREQEIVLSRMEKIFNPLFQAEIVADKKIDRLKELNVFQQLSKEEQASVKRILESGGTVESILQQLGI